MNNLPPGLPGQDYASQDFNDMRRSNRSLQPMTAPGTLITHTPGHGVMVRAARPKPQRRVESTAKTNFQGVYTPGTYNAMDEVVIQSGARQGEYVCLADNNTNAPTTGIDWIQVSSLNQWF
jgi:hypothetical protein